MYDISSREWTELPPLTQPKWRCAAIVVNAKIYAFGGINGKRLLECEVLDLSQSDSQFTHLPNDLPQVLYDAVAVSKGHWIYVIGGRNSNFQSVNTVYAFDTRTNEWNDELPHMRESRASTAVAILGDTLVVAGGWNREGGIDNYLESVETLDLKTSKWTNTIQSMPSPRVRAMAFVEQGSSNLIIAGGQYNDDNKPATTYLRYNRNSWTEYGNFPAMTDHNGSIMVVVASRKCLYYVDRHRDFKGLSFTTNKTVMVVHFGPEQEELQRLEETK